MCSTLNDDYKWDFVPVFVFMNVKKLPLDKAVRDV